MSYRRELWVKKNTARTCASYEELFEEIVQGIVGSEIPVMPAELEPYSEAITNAQCAGEASAVFAQWLRGRQRMGDDRFTSSGITDAPPCASVDVRDAFVPDFPEVDEFADGAADFGFIVRQANAEIEMAIAKQVCFTQCALRVQCLARSIGADGSYRKSQDIDPWSVSGGWGERARQMIASKFHVMRRDYLAGRMSAEDVQLYERLSREPILAGGLSA